MVSRVLLFVNLGAGKAAGRACPYKSENWVTRSLLASLVVPISCLVSGAAWSVCWCPRVHHVRYFMEYSNFFGGYGVGLSPNSKYVSVSVPKGF